MVSNSWFYEDIGKKNIRPVILSIGCNSCPDIKLLYLATALSITQITAFWFRQDCFLLYHIKRHALSKTSSLLRRTIASTNRTHHKSPSSTSENEAQRH